MDNKQIRKDRLWLLVSEAGSIIELARMLGMRSGATLSQILSAKPGRSVVRNVGDKLARKLEEACNKPYGWMDQPLNDDEQQKIALSNVEPEKPPPSLWFGTEEESAPDRLGFFRGNTEPLFASESKATYHSPQKSSWGRFPVAGQPSERKLYGELVPISTVELSASAGVSGFQVEGITETSAPIFFRRAWVQSKGWNPAKLLAVHVAGASMEPALYDGDLIVINTAQTEPSDGCVFAVNYEGEVVVKRLKRDQGEWWIASDNPNKQRFPDKKLDEHAYTIGKVVYRQSEVI